ncbi:hypothetical protein [Parasphingorhabdus sp.]|uniref:hypothetical protein n=1 Tax=Parasphingorhabdus sp. TaxID=2709688 RepID=UPI003A8E57DB
MKTIVALILSLVLGLSRGSAFAQTGGMEFLGKHQACLTGEVGANLFADVKPEILIDNAVASCDAELEELLEDTENPPPYAKAFAENATSRFKQTAIADIETTRQNPQQFHFQKKYLGDCLLGVSVNNPPMQELNDLEMTTELRQRCPRETQALEQALISVEPNISSADDAGPKLRPIMLRLWQNLEFVR